MSCVGMEEAGAWRVMRAVRIHRWELTSCADGERVRPARAPSRARAAAVGLAVGQRGCRALAVAGEGEGRASVMKVKESNGK